METKRIKCPSCGVLLDVRNSQNEAVKMITCPQCKAQLRVMFSQQHAATPQSFGETQYIGNSNGETQYVNRDNGETRYVGLSSSPSQSDETILADKKEEVTPGYLLYGGQKYPLGFGNNVIGRKATVQIASDDRYMSRQHLVIQVIKVSTDKVRVVVSNYHNKNASYVNGQLLNEGDQLVLTEGSIIKMGNTTVVYHQK